MTKQKILVVDDSPMNLEIIEDMLEDQYELCNASSGEEALSKISDFCPHLVLLDVMMPGINGYEVCRTLRNNPAFSQLKIIMLSAKASKEDIQQGLNAGADAYVTKPFEISILIEKISSLLEQP